MKKILFETHHLYYLPNFLPVIESLRSRGGYEIFVSMPQYMQERERNLFYNAANDLGLGLISADLEEERIEKNYDFIQTPLTRNFFSDTDEILEYVKYYPNHYKAMNPNLPKFNNIDNPFHLWAKNKKL